VNIEDEDRTACFFEIHVKGHLNPDWANWLEDLEMTYLDNGEMILSGTLIDQAALIGVLNKLNRLNLTILSVNETNRKDTDNKTNGPSSRNSC
jgi:hypothetical protein